MSRCHACGNWIPDYAYVADESVNVIELCRDCGARWSEISSLYDRPYRDVTGADNYVFVIHAEPEVPA